MSNEQRKFLRDFCQNYPPSEWTINTVEYPAGITAGNYPGKNYLNTVKVVYTLDNDPERMYIDYIGNDGFPVHTESRKKVTA